jgi:hypothetical protein
MSSEVQLWRVIYDGQEYSILHDNYDTDHQVVATHLSFTEACAASSKMNKKNKRSATGDFFTGLMHISAEAAGHAVKTIKDGYDKGRK